MSKNCENCALKNSFPEDVDYCIALSRFIEDKAKPLCEGKHFTAKTNKPRHKELLDAVSRIRRSTESEREET